MVKAFPSLCGLIVTLFGDSLHDEPRGQTTCTCNITTFGREYRQVICAVDIKNKYIPNTKYSSLRESIFSGVKDEYVALNSTCKVKFSLLEIEQRSPEVDSKSPVSKQAISTENEKHGLVGEKCNDNSSCKHTDVYCFDGRCRCRIGLSGHARGTCVPRCDEYGSTFTTYEGHSTNAHNTKVFPLIDFEQCKQKCVAETDFVCVSVEMGYKEIFRTLPQCHLSNASYLDAPKKDRRVGKQGNTRYTFSTRNCRHP